VKEMLEQIYDIHETRLKYLETTKPFSGEEDYKRRVYRENMRFEQTVNAAKKYLMSADDWEFEYTGFRAYEAI
jgi:hypothetical protein